MKSIALVLILCTTGAQIHAQGNRDSVDSLLLAINEDDSLSNSDKSYIFDTLATKFAEEKNLCAELKTREMQVGKLDGLGLLDSAIAMLLWIEDSYDTTCSRLILEDLYVRYTNVYLSLEDLDQVDTYVDAFFEIWDSATGDWENKFAALNNSGIAYAQRGATDTSTMLFRQVYHEARQRGNRTFVQRSLANLGTIKGMEGDFDSAYFYLNTAALEALEENDEYALMPLLINLSNIDMERQNYDFAEILLDSAYTIAERLEDADMMSDVVDNLAYIRQNQEDYEDAYFLLREYTDLREEYLNAQRVRTVAQMNRTIESERQARIIQQLEVEQLRIRNTRNRLLVLGGFVLLLALALWNRLLFVRRSRAAIEHEKEISDGLLLNILPASVAEELKERGRTEAKYYETATIMFSDFENFTRKASDMPAAELVEAINIYFQTFDEIIAKNGIEKIKTIGDAYMAAGGIDANNPSAAVDVVRTAIEIQEYVVNARQQRSADGKVAFDMRVGIHSGPVVAGIVGVKKFQYDLWGDTVNIASRMESAGTPGKINISESTYQLIKDDPSFTFESRGMVDVKGKGAMQMYYVALVNGGTDD